MPHLSCPRFRRIWEEDNNLLANKKLQGLMEDWWDRYLQFPQIMGFTLPLAPSLPRYIFNILFASISSRINMDSTTASKQQQFKRPQSSVPRRNLGCPSPPGTGTHHGCFGQFEHRPRKMQFGIFLSSIVLGLWLVLEKQNKNSPKKRYGI